MRNGFVVNTKKNAIVENKIAVIGLTFGLDDPRPNRRLKDFTFHNDNGKPHTVKMLEIDNLFISGIILFLKECSEKERKRLWEMKVLGKLNSMQYLDMKKAY